MTRGRAAVANRRLDRHVHIRTRVGDLAQSQPAAGTAMVENTVPVPARAPVPDADEH